MVELEPLSRLLVPVVAGGAAGGSLAAAVRFVHETRKVRSFGRRVPRALLLLALLPLTKAAVLLLVPAFPEGPGASDFLLPLYVCLLAMGAAAFVQGLVIASLLPGLLPAVPRPAGTARRCTLYAAKVLALFEISSLLPFLTALVLLALPSG